MDWNLVAECRPGFFWRMCSLLGTYGELEQTRRFNVVVAKVEIPRELPERLVADLGGERELLFATLARIAPADLSFRFKDLQDLRRRVIDTSSRWNEMLAGEQVGVQTTVHETSGHWEQSRLERVITDTLNDSLRTPAGIIPFEAKHGPVERLLVVEAIGERVGMSLWSWVEAARFPVIRRE